ncbi:MAG TPA: ATP-binding protein [Cytophagales bacterium]|nr:ATP-binding protein [Cytophagales bacterium]
MAFDRRSPLVQRLAILLVTLLAWAWVSRQDNFMLFLLLLGAIVFQVYQLVEKPTRSEPPPASPTTDAQPGFRFDETTFSLVPADRPDSLPTLNQRIQEALQRARNTRVEKDSDFQFFKNIVQHVGIGLIVFKQTGQIQIINTAARRLLKIQKADHLDELVPISRELIDTFQKLKTGGRELVRVKLSDEVSQLSVYAIELTVRGEAVKLISMSNIQSELEQKEMEAWQNLVRVLTHEIMNSVTPISSLAGIVEEELRSYLGSAKSLSAEQLGDMHLSVQTISKRSEGLIHFVREFRSLTQVPQPHFGHVAVGPLLHHVTLLHRQECAEADIEVSIHVQPDQLALNADKNLTEQVLINLFRNAVQSFDRPAHRKIMLTGLLIENRPAISVKDTGSGIEPEALEKIFIPFYSTKKAGSGIGLSLSRQIMRQHNGSISVKSAVGAGTEFILRF